MELDAFCFMVGLVLVPFSHMLFANIFYQKKYTLPFFVTALVMAIIGLLAANYTEGYQKPNFYLFLICPLYGLIVLKALLYLFKQIYKRTPKGMRDIPSAFFPDDDFGGDRLFHLAFRLLSCCLPLLLLAYYYP